MSIFNRLPQNEVTPFSRFAAGLWLALACFVAYANIYGNGFIWDELDFIVKNYEIRSLFPLVKFFRSASTIAQRPVMSFSLALDYRLWGLNPAGYHLTQVLLHALSSCLVYFVLFRLVGSFWPAFLSGLLFAWHPVHSEAVSAFLGRSELLTTAATLVMLWTFLVHIQRSGPWSWLMYAFSLAAFGVAVLSKESGIVAPILLAWLLLLDRQAGAVAFRWGGLLLRFLPFAILSLWYFHYRSSVVMISHAAWWGGGPWRTFLMMMTVLWEYARLLFFPVRLSPWYITPVPTGFGEWKVVAGAFVLGVSLVLIILFWKKAWLLSLGIGWILLALLPVSNLIPIPGSMMAERWVYLPSVGFCWGIGWLFSKGVERLKGKPFARMLTISGFGLIGVLMLVRVWTWNTIWHDGERFYRTMLSRGIENTWAYSNLGDLYLEKARYREAVREYASTLFYAPRSARALEGLGATYWSEGLNGEALHYLRHAVAIDTEFTQARYSLGLALAGAGDTSGALREFHWVLKKEPLNPAPNEMAGTLLLGTGHPEEALKYFEKALTMKPRSSYLRFKAGQADLALGQWNEAERELLQALKYDPRFWQAYEDLTVVYERQGRWREAAEARRKFLSHDSL